MTIDQKIIVRYFQKSFTLSAMQRSDLQNRREDEEERTFAMDRLTVGPTNEPTDEMTDVPFFL